MLQEIFNDIKKTTSHWGLTLAIVLWSFGSPPGLHLPKWELLWECECSLLHTPSHFLTLSRVCDVTPRDPLGPHPYHAFALTAGLPLGSHPCKPFALVASPRLGLRQKLSQFGLLGLCEVITLVQTSNWHEIESKLVALLKSFPTVYRTLPARTEVGLIPDF
jgi:hypothetical protein